ncbi:BTAD domain-containing putative transcriptional regulator [Streptomyces sp. B15]|uniref:BTAD domain-containing putative transcriptional regulator n=1 Tax=Streptomyces sp. B15 TaxID=1537797 RepID=UPI0027DB88EB|nr:BTAD domain-containing putative transcriptional regulator [Streptomyces sp. B15]
MGRREKPIITSNRALADLARWLRQQRVAHGLTYAQLAARTGRHATTLQRAASAASVPTAAVVEAYARGCGASVEVALQLWRRARQERLRTSAKAKDRQSVEPEAVTDAAALAAALWELYSKAGGPSVREMERRAGGFGRLPHSTVHRILRGQAVPRDVQQLVAFLIACEMPAGEQQPWVDAWRRVCESAPPVATEADAEMPSSGGALAAERTVMAAEPMRQEPASGARDREILLGERREGGLRFSVLGPVRAWRDGQALSMGSPQQRALLATLLLRGGRTATAEELIDAIWGEEPPEQAKAALRTYASRLRKTLGGELLVSESGGYAVRTGLDAALDVETAHELAVRAEKAATGGDRAQARELYIAALAQWDGAPLAHIPGPFAEHQRVRLEEWRLGLLELRLDLDLQVGCHAEAVSELTALTAAHPLRERLRELLMLALYRSGRQAEALAVYTDTRRLLADELGVDPRPELAELQQRILEADDELAYRADTRSPSAAIAVTRPAQLPATVADFTGRASFVAELSDQLTQAEGTVMAVSAVAGIGGVGKTTLAIHVAHAAADHFPDGQLYVDLQGTGASPTDPEAVLGAFLRSFGIPAASVPDGAEERSALFRSLLAGRRILVLLDNARDAAQVRPLLPGTAGCAALVTSRARMVDLVGAHLVDLDVLCPDEAMTLFTRVVGEERVLPEREAAMDVVAACGFLPLAIRIAAARLSARRTWTVSALAAKLRNKSRRLDELQVGDQAVKATFELSYSQLDREQARAFRLLGLTESPDISLDAAAALLDRTLAETEAVLEVVVDTSLLESAGPGHYRFHNLVRLSARSRTDQQQGDAT